MKALILLLSVVISQALQAQQYVTGKRQQQIFFEGNSLMNATNIPVALLPYGFYVPTGVYNNVRTGRVLSYTCYAIAGRTQTQINSSRSTNIYPYLRKGDVILLWEGTNDLYVNDLSAADAFTNLLTYTQDVRSRGAKVVVCTVIARDYSLDDPDLMDRVDAYNALVRANPSEFDAICDLAADPVFDTRADCSNTTYYNVDKIHLATGGSDVVIALMSDTLGDLLQ